LFDPAIQLKYTKHGETKTIKVNVKIVTDAVLICKTKKKKSSLIRPPIRTDRITPVMQEGKELCLIVTNDFTCPIAVYTLCFEDAKHQNVFLNYFIEARTRYNRFGLKLHLLFTTYNLATEKNNYWLIF
jgi:hypothetical protein